MCLKQHYLRMLGGLSDCCCCRKFEVVHIGAMIDCILDQGRMLLLSRV